MVCVFATTNSTNLSLILKTKRPTTDDRRRNRFTSDMYGRRNCYFVSTAVIALFGLLCTASQNIETLIALRFVVGLGLGGVTCSFTLLSEVVGKAHRGKKIILSMGLLWTAGCILASVTAWICFTLIPSIDWQWKAYVILAAVP
jgi:putative MFS transporter